MIEEKAVAIDADFFQSVTHLDNGEFFKSLMEELGVIPVMHLYVADVELKDHIIAQKLLNEKYIRKIFYDDFLLTDNDRRKYKEDVWQLYDQMTGEPAPKELHRNIFRKDFRLSGKNLGEIMTELMAKTMRIPVFMSNDKGAKHLAAHHINSARYTLQVKNLEDVLAMIGERDNSLKWSEIKHVLNSAGLEKSRMKIRHFWNDN